MTDLMEMMYGCASKVFTPELLNEDGEYSSRTQYIELEIKQLFADLDRDTMTRVDNVLTNQEAIGQIREAASFRAGFRMALELTR